MTPPVVSHWLAVLRRCSTNVSELAEIRHGVERFDRLVASGDPRASVPGVAEAAANGRLHVAENLEYNRTVLDLVSRARLFDLSDEVAVAAGRRVEEMVGVPDIVELPFDVCWFRAEYDDDKSGLRVLGYLISRGGWMGVCYRDKDGNADFACERVVNDDGWEPSAVQGAWTLWLLSRVVAGHVAERPVTSSFAVRRELAKARAAGAPIQPPPDLYVLRLDSRRAGHAIGKIVAARNGPSYRYEVRRHERMLVHRGRWPIAPDLAADFSKRGYAVERGDLLDDRAAIGLDLRGLPGGARDEWVAWKFAPVREHEAGPKDAPVRRAVRVAASRGGDE